MDSIARGGGRLTVAAGRPRVMFVGSVRYDLPLSPWLARKWDAVEAELDLKIIGRAGAVGAEDRRFRLVKGPLAARGGTFYAWLPVVVATELRRFQPHVVVTQSPYEAFAARLAWPRRNPPRLIVEIHGDWRTAARLYGPRSRRLAAKLADRAAQAALRRADATRALSAYTSRLVEEVTGDEATASFPAYIDLASFTASPPRPLPDVPTVAWIGALEGPKDPRALADAWRFVTAEVPNARLVIVGEGRLRPVVDALEREFPSRVQAIPRLSPAGVAEVLDESTLLVLPSASEGYGRVILEAFARGRAVVATRVGGMPDLIRPNHSGLLVEPGRSRDLADALTAVLTDRALAERLGRGGFDDAQRLPWTAQAYASALRGLVDRVLADGAETGQG